MLDEIVLDVVSEAHRELKNMRTVCPICKTKYGPMNERQSVGCLDLEMYFIFINCPSDYHLPNLFSNLTCFISVDVETMVTAILRCYEIVLEEGE